MYYFAYGSNMDTNDLQKWCIHHGKDFPVNNFTCTAFLEDYKLVFNYFSRGRNGGAANIMESQGDIVYGIIFQINENDRATLRVKEGHPKYYHEISVTVKSLLDQKKIHAITYKVVNKKETETHQKTTIEYMNLILKNAKEYNFPKDYIQYLESIETQ